MEPIVLLAEGKPELCAIYRQVLHEGGYQVETASDGLDCLSQLKRLEPAVLVLDLDLRWGGGDGILAWLREQDPTHTLPVILTTGALPPGRTSPSALARQIEPPVLCCLRKPFPLIELLKCVRSALASRQPPLAERVGQALRATGYRPLHSLQVAINERRVILRGQVSSYYLKQMAQTAALALPEVQELRNEVKVVRTNS